MATVLIFNDKASTAEFIVKRQVRQMVGDVATWIDDKGDAPVTLQNGEGTSGDFANDSHRLVVEMKPLDLTKPLPKGFLERIGLKRP